MHCHFGALQAKLLSRMNLVVGGEAGAEGDALWLPLKGVENSIL
jgi:hypothetical protein